MTTEQLLIALLRTVLCQIESSYTPTFSQFKAVYKLAAKHDLAHLVYYAAEQNGILPTPADESEHMFLEKAATAVATAQYRYVKLEAELAHISQVFEREGISYMPLKGAVLRGLYPQPWMRTSCDIDILVHEEDLDRAAQALVAEGFETDGIRNYHDMSLFCDGVHLELHHNVLERHPQMDAVLAQIWEHTLSKGFYHLEKPAFYVFHHLAHMAHHFLCGGCGIRTVMDLWLLLKHSDCSSAEVLALCEQGGLSVFTEQMCALANVWFGDGEHDEDTRRIEQFILCGGVYGSHDQRSASSAARHGKAGTALRVIFTPYEDLKKIYPSLDGKPHLTWYYQLCRIVTRLSQKRGKGAIGRIKAVGEQSKESVDQMKALLSSVGLYKSE